MEIELGPVHADLAVREGELGRRPPYEMRRVAYSGLPHQWLMYHSAKIATGRIANNTQASPIVM
jgi:hypothetical protein